MKTGLQKLKKIPTRNFLTTLSFPVVYPGVGQAIQANLITFALKKTDHVLLLTEFLVR